MTPDRADELATKAVRDYHNPLNTDEMATVIASAIRAAMSEARKEGAAEAWLMASQYDIPPDTAAFFRKQSALRQAALKPSKPKPKPVEWPCPKCGGETIYLVDTIEEGKGPVMVRHCEVCKSNHKPSEPHTEPTK